MYDSGRSTIEYPRHPEVRVIFKGLVISQIKHGTGKARIHCLDHSIDECHQPKIHVYHLLPDGRTEILNLPVNNNYPDCYLMVSPEPLRANIQVFQTDDGDFNRLDEKHNHRKDFRWFTDLFDIHRKCNKIDLNYPKLKPKFVMNKGIFHTSLRSDGDVKIIPRDGHTPVRHFGKFAVEITARVSLAAEAYGTKVEFRIGGQSIFCFTKEEKKRYDIIYDCSCHHYADDLESDYGLIYRGINVPPEYRVMVEVDDPYRVQYTHKDGDSDRNVFIASSPEVYCVGGNHSR